MKNIIDNIIQINDDIFVLLIKNNINKKMMLKLGLNLSEDLDNNTIFRNTVKATLALASAVTSYARITMIPYKLLPGTVYTDTDSIFTTDVLPDDLLGKELGLMKDELDGKIIAPQRKAIF